MKEYNQLSPSMKQWIEVAVKDGKKEDQGAAQRSLSIALHNRYRDLCKKHTLEEAEQLLLEKLGDPSVYYSRSEQNNATIILIVASILFGLQLLCDVIFLVTRWDVMFSVQYLYNQTGVILAGTVVLTILFVVSLNLYRKAKRA